MMTVLLILGTLVALILFPCATLLGLLGVWIFGFWGALVGILIGLTLQGSAA